MTGTDKKWGFWKAEGKLWAVPGGSWRWKPGRVFCSNKVVKSSKDAEHKGGLVLSHLGKCLP
jgi:hypothetical protein